ncbi:hypothetical protein MJ561_13685 [Klebsiella pneumoniae]|nr:hypothetical protein MJ561_13685 [Klebsiella pneumoniae]
MRRPWRAALSSAEFGTRLAMGCSLAAFFTGIPQFSCAWLFAIATAIGSWFGARFTLHCPFFASR